MSRDKSAFTVPRMPSKRVFCVCCGFARLTTSGFRANAVPSALPSRIRGLFHNFTPGFLEDHWVCEYWDGEQWHLLDAELDQEAVTNSGIAFAPSDVPRDQFVDAAWDPDRMFQPNGLRSSMRLATSCAGRPMKN